MIAVRGSALQSPIPSTVPNAGKARKKSQDRRKNNTYCPQGGKLQIPRTAYRSRAESNSQDRTDHVLKFPDSSPRVCASGQESENYRINGENVRTSMHYTYDMLIQVAANFFNTSARYRRADRPSSGRRFSRSNDKLTPRWSVGLPGRRADRPSQSISGAFIGLNCNERDTGSFLDSTAAPDFPRSPRALNTMQPGDVCTPH